MKRSLEERHTQTHRNKKRYFNNHRCLSWSEESKCVWTCGANFTVCSHTFTLFWSRKTSVFVKMSHLVSKCLCVPFLRRSLHFLVRVSLFFPIFCVIRTSLLSFPRGFDAHYYHTLNYINWIVKQILHTLQIYWVQHLGNLKRSHIKNKFFNVRLFHFNTYLMNHCGIKPKIPFLVESIYRN